MITRDLLRVANSTQLNSWFEKLANEMILASKSFDGSIGIQEDNGAILVYGPNPLCIFWLTTEQSKKEIWIVLGVGCRAYEEISLLELCPQMTVIGSFDNRRDAVGAAVAAAAFVPEKKSQFYLEAAQEYIN